MRCGKVGGSATVEWNFCEADKTTLVMAPARLLRSSPFERAEAANERRVLKIIRPVNRRWPLSRENNAQLANYEIRYYINFKICYRRGTRRSQSALVCLTQWTPTSLYFCASNITATRLIDEGKPQYEVLHFLPFCTFILSNISYPSTASLSGMILLAMKLFILLAMFHYKVARDYIPKEMLLLFQHIESLWEY